MKRTFSAAFLAGSLGVLGSAPAHAQVVPTDAAAVIPFLQVSGTARVTVPSDRARINFAVVTEAPTAAEAASQNATRMEQVSAALRGTGTRGLDIESWGYDLQPRYARTTNDNPEPRIVGYQANNNVRVTVDDVNAVGELIDAAVQAGVNQVTALQFEARNTAPARAEALRLAVESARLQAESMADAMGLTLGMPLEVQGGAEPPMPRPMPYNMDARMSMEMAVQSTPIEAAEQEVYANVSIKYRLEGGG